MTERKLRFKQKYNQLQKLGQGKMGIVFKVQKKVKTSPQFSPLIKGTPQPQFYAAKHIQLSKIDLQAARKQLKILEQLKHMYIVKFYEDFIEDDELILIMDYCEGMDLDFHIQNMKKKGKYFNESVVSTWIFQLILVVQYIHSSNIIHRDIKPQNIFVDKDMNLKIGDFGVSKLLDGSENCQTMAGTPLYFSPELTKSQPYTKKTDIWSLGCVIYEICALQKPFMSKKGLFELINAIQNQEPKNIPKLYSNDLNKLIRKMLVKDPKKRPTSRELLQDPILVQLMINYSSQINLKQEYEHKGIQKPNMTQSFIQVQSNAVNERLIKFQEEVKQKMDSLKNKKVKSSEIDKYYADIQNKMKNLRQIVDSAFQQLKMKSEPQPQQVKLQKSNKSNASNVSNVSRVDQTKIIKSKQSSKARMTTNNNSSNFSQSDETIKSIELTPDRKKNKQLSSSNLSQSDATIKSIILDPHSKISKQQQQKHMQNKILQFNQSNSSISSASSIMIESKKSFNKSMGSSSSSKFGTTSQKFNMSKKQPIQLDATLKSQFVQTIKKTDNVGEVRNCTLSHIDQISKQILNNPNLIFDQTFLDVTLSLSNNEVGLQGLNAFKNKNIQPDISIGKSCSSSGKTINFDFTKRQYQDTLSLSSSSKKPLSQTIKSTLKQPSLKSSQGQKDSLDEDYEADFESYEEDKQMDIRQQQKKCVKQLFASTLKNFTMVKNDSNGSSVSNQSINPRNKYSLTLSTIREQSSEGGSTISYNQEFQ